jgi:uncharacterized repeat protein (TIGR03837 family)
VDNLGVPATKQWDIFCRVIDNYGDIGVCWRLSADLAARGQRVRLWVDDASALAWLAPNGAAGVELRNWRDRLDLRGVTPGEVLIEAFGCEIAPEFIALYAHYTTVSGQSGFWINLEYLSAEAYAERCHALLSPVLAGPGIDLTKYFFYPGFTTGTGGLIREAQLARRRADFDPANWLAAHGLASGAERLISLFCYEPPGLGELLQLLASGPAPTRLLVTPGRAQAAVRLSLQHLQARAPQWNQLGRLRITELPHFSQADYDHLLWSCDLNFVRGEDSLVRALWAEKPFVWQAYPQQDQAHHAKLQALLDTILAPPTLRRMHQIWNGLSDGPLPALDLPEWRDCVHRAAGRMARQNDLTTQLIQFTQKNR